MKMRQINPPNFKKLSQELQTYIDNNRTGSILCVVYHQGKTVYRNKFGWKDKEKQIPIAFDDIFRIYSMTKLIIQVDLIYKH